MTVASRRVGLAIAIALCAMLLVHCPQVTSGPHFGCTNVVGDKLGRPFPNLPRNKNVLMLTLEDAAPGITPGAAYYKSFQPNPRDPFVNIGQLTIGGCQSPSDADAGAPTTESSDAGPIHLDGLAEPVELHFADGEYVPDRAIQRAEVVPGTKVTFVLDEPPEEEGIALPDSRVEVVVPQPLEITAPQDGASIPRGRDLEVRWTGAGGGFLLAVLRGADLGGRPLTIFCRALDRPADAADDGGPDRTALVIPVAQLDKLKGQSLTLELLRMNSCDLQFVNVCPGQVDASRFGRLVKLEPPAVIALVRRSVELRFQN
jgi:hypothetical protein